MGSILIIDDLALRSMLREFPAPESIPSAPRAGEVSAPKECGDNHSQLVVVGPLPTSGLLEATHSASLSGTVRLLRLSLTMNVGPVASFAGVNADTLLSPAASAELVSRLRMLVREGPLASNDGTEATQTSLDACVDGFALDATIRAATYRGKSLALTQTEFALLRQLLESPGVILGREQLANRLYGRSLHPLDRRLDMLVSRLRRKLEQADHPGGCVRTIRGSGYVYRTPGKQGEEIISQLV